MKLNLKKARKFIEKPLIKEHGDCFEIIEENDALSINTWYELWEGEEIYFDVSIFEDGGAVLGIFFDKLDATDENLELINQFNNDSIFFKAMITEDGDLEVRHDFLCQEETLLSWYVPEIFNFAFILDSSEPLKELYSRTYVLKED